MKRNLNVEIDGYRVDDVFGKIGAIFGKKGRHIGRVIDKLTNDVTLKVDTNSRAGQGNQEAHAVKFPGQN